MSEPTTIATYQLFKNLSPAIESALRASIDRFGVLVPVAKDQHGNILDGHQRARIADELGAEYPVTTIECSGGDMAREIARTLNEDRREMPKEQRLEVVKALREEGYSTRAIAGAVRVSEPTVRRDLSGASLDAPPAVRSRSGRICEQCKQAVATEPHHLRYGPDYDPSKVIHVCHQCHCALEGLSA